MAQRRLDGFSRSTLFLEVSRGLTGGSALLSQGGSQGSGAGRGRLVPGHRCPGAGSTSRGSGALGPKQ